MIDIKISAGDFFEYERAFRNLPVIRGGKIRVKESRMYKDFQYAIINAFKAQTARVFRMEGFTTIGSGFKKWAPLNETYAKDKTGFGILRETDAMYDFLMNDRNYQILDDNTIFINMMEMPQNKRGYVYGVAHMTGTKKMAVRQYMGLEPQTLADIKKAFVIIARDFYNVKTKYHDIRSSRISGTESIYRSVGK